MSEIEERVLSILDGVTKIAAAIMEQKGSGTKRFIEATKGLSRVAEAPDTKVSDTPAPSPMPKPKQAKRKKRVKRGRKPKVPSVEYGKEVPWISVLRVAHGLGQKAAAKAIGSTEGQYRRYERMVDKVPSTHQEAMCKLLGGNRSELFGSNGYPLPCDDKSLLLEVK